MKRLICADNVEELVSHSTNSIYIDKNTIITPSAVDKAETLGIEIIYRKKTKEENSIMNSEKIYTLLKKLIDNNMLADLFPKFDYWEHENGFKLIKGNTVKMSILDETKNGEKIFVKELIKSKEGQLKAGLIEIENSTYSKKIEENQVNYIIEGELKVKIDNEEYLCKQGDIVYFPKNTKVKINGKTKMFFAKC
ncbi:MAG: cupin domain-containing protein [Miniphocaeibacter sp.]|jgi:ethanolamine utilization protein EutQ|uniref:cupin domain-containing protein n=1 Tax=Miniphocaeibacter sp. TaxID=3100973 RepID=UPI001811E585|nr:DUF861 domain-containing protein [Gallicola sp.]